MTALETAKASLVRMQEFKADELVRRDDLGARFSFEDVVEPAKRLIRFYGQLSPSSLDDLPANLLEHIRSTADADYNRLSQILAFDPAKEPNPAPTRDALILQVRNAYDATFNALSALVSYGISKVVDFGRIENDARAMIQSVTDSAAVMASELKKSKEDAERILGDVRKAAAEQGVTQQAIYFKDEADSHETAASKWRTATVWLSIGLGVVALASLWLHQLPGLDADNPLRALQIGSSKLLVFVVIGYMLILAARNYLAHRHNSVVNRHRQNALLTFQTLVNAAKGEEAKDVILAHAASCIFAPQETGYSKMGEGTPLTRSIIELLPKSASKRE